MPRCREAPELLGPPISFQKLTWPALSPVVESSRGEGMLTDIIKSLREDPRFAENANRVKNYEALMLPVRDIIKEKTVDEWLPLLRDERTALVERELARILQRGN